MAGRPRRRRASSTSTVEPIDHSQIRWKKESSVLKPAPRDISDNDWPCYVLKDATVYRKDGKTLANPLLVHLEGPLVVRGLLEVVEDEQVHNLVRPSVKSAYIEIPHSDQYSIGDSPLSLWVAGAAGWFEICPSAQFQAMYDQVREATTLYYSAFDVYEGYNEACQGKKKQRRPPPPKLDDIFLKYAVRAGDGILLHEAKALCDKWAGFLISHFTREVDLDWNPTLFAKSLREAHPDVQKTLADIANGLVPPPPPPPEMTDSDEPKAARNRRSRSARASSRNSEVEDNMRGPALDRSRSPQAKPANKPKPKTSETPVPLPERYRQFAQPVSSMPSPAPAETPKPDPPRDTPMSDADAESPVDRLLGVLRDIASEKDIHKAAPSKIHSEVFFRCKIRHYSEREDILAYYAKDLLPRLGLEWKGTPWYVWLTGAAKRPWKPTEPIKPEDIPPQTFRRTKLAKQGPSTKAATQLPPALNLKARTKPAVQNESESEEDIAELYTAPQRNRRSGKGATLRLATSSKKRPRSELDDQPNCGRRGKKSAKVSHPLSDEDDLEDDDDTSGDEAATGEDSAVGSRLPLPEGAVRVVVHAERMPTTSPSGPDGTWTCEHEGCTYVVRSADEQDAQALIRAHFRDHEAQAEKIDLAVKESRGHMPINHLLSKIQALGKIFKKRDTVDGTPVPAPVKRRLLI